MQNIKHIKLEKKGRFTYLSIGNETIRCASAAAGKKLLECLQASQHARKPVAAGPGGYDNPYKYASMPWFNWSRGYGIPPDDHGHECDHYLDESRPEILVKDDAGNWVQATALASTAPLRPKPPTPPLTAAKNLVAALEQDAARLKALGEARTVWTVKNLGLTDKDIDDLREHPEREPMGCPGDRPKSPWEPWEEWCIYEELGPINSKVDGETQMRLNIDKTRQSLRYDEVQKIIESGPLKRYSLVLTRGWYRTAYMDRIERVVDFGGGHVPIASTAVNRTAAICAFPGTYFDLDCAGMVWQPNGGYVEIGLLVIEKFAGKRYKATPRFYAVAERRAGYPANEWPRRWEGAGLIVL